MAGVYQRTLYQAISVAGIGLHSGEPVLLTLKPAAVNTGICFVRTDLDNASVPLNAFLVQDTMMSSNLIKDGVRVGTIEHLLSAVAALGIDNLIIEVSAPEVPIMDGSAVVFLSLMKQAGLCQQAQMKYFLRITRDVCVYDGDKWAKISPDDDGFKLAFEIDFAHQVIADTPQRFCFELSSTAFAQEIAPARTFGFLKDLDALRRRHLALGASLDNAVVLDDDKVLNAGGLRYPEEFVRHKILDAIGDLYAIGYPLLGYFQAYKSGHTLNNKLIRAILSDPTCHEFVTFYDTNACPIAYQSADFEPITTPKYDLGEQLGLYA